jgi:methionine-rich copper-binding protein CopC
MLPRTFRVAPVVSALVVLTIAGAVADAAPPLGAVSRAPSVALRHLRLLRSFPAKDTVLSAAPDSIRLWLSEPAEVATSRIVLVSGKRRTPLTRLTRAAAKDAPLVAPVTTTLVPGMHTVEWRTMSKDGHVVKGSFAFRVAPSARASK